MHASQYALQLLVLLVVLAKAVISIIIAYPCGMTQNTLETA